MNYETEPITFLFVTGDMKTMLLFLFWFLSSTLFGQARVLFTGNTSSLCYDIDTIEITMLNTFPDSISEYDAIFIFSSAQSILSEKNIEHLNTFLKSGKGVYIGSENWPLQAESHQLTTFYYSKQAWGNFTSEKAKVAEESILYPSDTISSGTTTVAFPMDYRLKVEAWIDDEPLISSGELMGGKVILDGGYSRFYCAEKNKDSQQILERFIQFLCSSEH